MLYQVWRCEMRFETDLYGDLATVQKMSGLFQDIYLGKVRKWAKELSGDRYSNQVPAM
jgi:hypothetical protein